MKKNISILIGIVLILFGGQTSIYAQLTVNLTAPFYLNNADDVKTIKEKSLIVVLETESAAIIKSLAKDKKGLEYYKDQVKGKNEAIKFAVDKFWGFSKDIVYKNFKEAGSLLNSGKYVLLNIGSIHTNITQRTGAGSNGRVAGFYKDSNTGDYLYNPSTKRTTLFDEVTTLEIWVPKKKYAAVIVNLPTDIPSKADLVYGIQQLQYVLNYVDKGNKIRKIEDDYETNYKDLANKTLLLDKDDLDEKLTEETIKNIYPYPFKIVETEEIDKAILEKNSQFAFVQLVPILGGKGKKMNHFVCDAETGKIYLTIEKKSALTIVGKTFGKNRIVEKHIKEYAKK